MSTHRNAQQEIDLVIFGCGYVGSAVAAQARTRGWSVTALTRNAMQAQALRSHGVEVIEAALESDEWHRAIRLERCRYILDSVSASGGGLPGYWKAYVDGTRSILRWAAPGVKATLVYTSSTSVYAASDGSVVDEDSATGGSDTAEPLLTAEQLFLRSPCFARTFALRLAGIYGPGRHYLLDQIREGAQLLPGTGTHRLNLAHRDDIVTAVFACFDAGKDNRGGIFNVAGGVAATKAEVATWLAVRLGRPPPQFAHDAGMVGPQPGLVRGRSGPVPDRVISIARIRDRLGWQPQFSNFRSGYEHVLRADGIRTATDGG